MWLQTTKLECIIVSLTIDCMGGTAELRIKLPTSHKALLMTSSQLNTAHLLLHYVGMENIQ